MKEKYWKLSRYLSFKIASTKVQELLLSLDVGVVIGMGATVKV